MENRRAYTSGLSSIAATAALSVVALLSVLAWQTYATLSLKNKSLQAISENSSISGDRTNAEFAGTAQIETKSATTSAQDPKDLSHIGSDAFGQLIDTYVGLKQSGAYTPARGEQVANNVASTFDVQVPYAQFRESDIKTDADVSYKRMLAYRSDMRTALLPLLQNTESEFGTFARYVETGDKTNLVQLEASAGRYKRAATNAESVIVPQDATKHHADVVNSLLKFSATLSQMVKYADDSMASLALLRAYNESELDVFTSFNSLASYQKNKIP
ncbi:MAG: hypothetical protein Q7S75_02355 [bacterium]|nr:hypothetical protein [bacterium]